MATFQIIEATPIYYVVDVHFSGLVFRQTLVSVKTNGNLNSQLQQYADQYESDWLSLQNAVVADY
jgi:hypothetical protein